MKKIYLLLSIILFISINSEAQSWVTCGPGTALGNASNGVKAIAVSPYDGSIYAGGTFTGTVNYLAKYNSTTDSWNQVGTGINGPVYALKFFKGKLYIGGSFTIAGGVTANNIVAVNSAGTYNTVGVGLNDQVNCLYAPSDSAYLYAGGRFNADFSTTIPMLHIGKTDLTTWSAVGTGISAVVNSIAQLSSTFYAGTENSINPLTKLNGSNWGDVTGLGGGKIYALASYSGYLYIGGDFNSPQQSAAKYDGSAFSTIITSLPFGTAIRSFLNVGNYLFIGGSFTNVGINSASYIGRIDGPNIPIKAVITANNPGSSPYAIGNKDGYIYLGGNFSASGYNVIKSSSTIGVDEISSVIESTSLYPNPISDKGILKVKLKSYSSNVSAVIMDSQGRIVENLSTEMDSNNEYTFSIEKKAMAAGIYYYTLNVDGNIALSNSFIIE